MNDDWASTPSAGTPVLSFGQGVNAQRLFNGSAPKNVPSGELAELNHARTKLITRTFHFDEKALNYSPKEDKNEIPTVNAPFSTLH